MSHLKIGFIIIFFSMLCIQLPCFKNLNSVEFFALEICSYNGTPTITQKDGISTVQCQCFEEYATDPNIRKMNGNAVQCSYKRKRRLKALFLALMLPVGASDFYLQRKVSFVVLLVTSTLGCCGGIIFFTKEERYLQTQTKQNGVDRDKTKAIFLKRLYAVFLILFIAYWIANCFLIVTGVLKDGYGFEMYNDLTFLINYFA